ncbi:MAG: hypothetical protein QMD85_04350 [Candidatus Aenigmarchaeota archaeon]|nr:hypothetical protein [Candidatus Aenigmarchaeota archaeon]MDI6722803.1 hypothetical protein [Candidatus Aenigmarchaeota archaeon]
MTDEPQFSIFRWSKKDNAANQYDGINIELKDGEILYVMKTDDFLEMYNTYTFGVNGKKIIYNETIK